jgi:predicted metal-dependent phosphoesterase TrpH
MMLMDLHMHSNYSDGKNTPEEMIEAAIEIGYKAVARNNSLINDNVTTHGVMSHFY